MAGITIDTPANGAFVLVGDTFPVTGETEPVDFERLGVTNTIWPVEVTLRVDGGPQQVAQPQAADWSSWSASVSVAGAGAHTITAVTRWNLPGQPVGRATVTVQAVVTLGALVEPTGPVGTQSFAVAVAGRPGIVTMRARADGQDWVALRQDSGRWVGSLSLADFRVPAGGRTVAVDLQGAGTDGVVRDGSGQITAVDATNPVVVSFTPSDGAKLPGTAVGAITDVLITVQDTGQGVLTSGITAVEARVDGGNWIPAASLTTGDPSTWRTRVFVPALDDHVIAVRVRDASQRVSPEVRHSVVVTARADLRDLSLQTYLQDLLTFAAERLLTRAPQGATDPPFVTAGHLSEALGHDVAGTARVGTAEGLSPVRSLRLVVEALARYLRPGPPAPLAAWPLREGQGTVVADTASGRATGTIEAASWVAAADPPVLRFPSGASARVRVDPQASAQARVRDEVTLVARIRPSQDTAEPGIVVNKEGEYELARYPDGTLQWALATTDPGWTWVNTGATAPVGEWTHVTVAYDGQRVRTWINGALRSTVAASGPIGDVDAANNELWIGGRPAVPQFFAGDIADVAVFGRALRESELHRLLGRSDDDGGGRLWVDDDLPPDAELDTDRDAWEWVTADPAPAGGTRCHRSRIAIGRHQHLFRLPRTAFPVDRGDVLVTDVWLDPLNPPQQVMLQWQDFDGSWEHRAYWGADLIGWGTDGTDSRRRIGDLPAAGAWVTLRVPARLVGLENQMVHGVGYVLFEGRAAWDRTGRVTAGAAATRSGHVAAAYTELLRAHGTSEVELRLARGATPGQRTALAQRLGITLAPARPDELDELLLDGEELNAAALAALFGYADPLGDAPPPPPLPALTRWRLATLRARWRASDRGGTAAVGQAPVLDPEVLVTGDIGDQAGAAAALLRDRIAWRQTQLQTLAAARAAADDDAAAVAGAFGTVLVGVDLDGLAAARRAGQDIGAGLTAAGLTQRDLLRLLQLRDLAATGPLRDAEWDDLVAALVRVLRRRRWASWRAAEATADVVVDPAVFRDSALTAGSGLPNFIDAAARQDWLDRLTARVLAVESIAAAQADGIARADHAALPLVREALLRTVDPGIPGLSVADALSSVLFVDVGAGPEDVTSRVGQAIEAVQGIVFAARTNRLVPQGSWPPAGPASAWVLRETVEYPRASFDQEWQWMGAYAAWQAAVSVFFRPELMLYPTLRRGATASYRQLLTELAAAGSDLTPQLARNQADAFNRRLDAATRTALDAVTVRGRVLGELVLTDQLSPDGIAALAAGEPQLLARIATFREVPRPLQEVLWLVPLQLAVALSRVGEHLAAVDWLRTLYAYDQSSAERVVFAGFRLEDGPPAPLQRPLNWLLGDELNPHRIADGRAGPQLRFTLLLLARCLVEQADAEFTADTQESRPRARELYLAASRSLRSSQFEDAQGPDVPRVPANSLLDALRGRVAANLNKLRQGLTIAGVPRPASAAYEGADQQLVLPSADGAPLTPPTRPPQPTPYRYPSLVARAQQLLALAAQVEASYLSAMVGADLENYSEQRANNDLELSRARTAVQQAAVDAAAEDVKVAQAQALRAKHQAETLDGWIAEGESDWEHRLLASYLDIAQWRTAVAFADAAVTVAGAAAAAASNSAAAPGLVGAAVFAAGARYLTSGALATAEARSQESATRASFERRAQEWQLQASLARDDEAIAVQQGEVLQRRATLAVQERTVAETEERHARAAVQYLAGRRLTGEMYAWMATQLGEVYRYLLRQATSVAQMAQQQLAFERQQPPPEIIKANYWIPGGVGAQGPNEPDRRGLTGSARLLRDLTELDQHAFETNRRKLNLEQVFPLSRTAPEAFAEFRRTGVLSFATPLDAFDRRFPGHFLRTIRRVRLAVVALVPSTQGIAATLACSGQSRVVVGQYGVFRPITLTRPPETVAYTSPVGATGIFELDPQPELKYFFEDHGVDTTWELRLPKAANPLDYRAIADVLVTVEYTALADADYARQVRAALPRRLRAALPLSIRDGYQDAWYVLAEGDPANPAVVPPVSLPVTLADFPRNIEDLRLEAVTLLVVRRSEGGEDAPDIAVDHLHLVRGNRRIEGGPATAANDVISTRLGTGAAWLPLVDPPDQVAPPGGSSEPWAKTPTGDWELALSSDPDTREALRSGEIADLVLVLSYAANLPAWPA
jgi:hypothetical protein